MGTGRGRAAAYAALLVALVAGLVAVPLRGVEAVERPATLYDERPVGLAAVETGFPIEHVGVVFDLPEHADATHAHDGGAHAGVGVELRFRRDGRWGAWQPVVEDGAQAVGRWTGALVPAGDADAYQVRGLPPFARGARAAALNTTDGPLRTVGHRPAGAAEAITPCKSRADWGADETLRTDSRSYAPVQLLTVHHTATPNDDPDPDARVRAIYEYHTRTNGWADIGYQALVSEAGVVYEGRWSGSDSPSCAAGGTGWEFGHQTTAADSQVVTGAHTGGYNTGNFGIALLGTLTDVAPKPAARDALVAYLAELAERHGLAPQGEVAYDNGTNSGVFDTISGHRDFTATECPGGTLYADLPSVRADVAAATGSTGSGTVDDVASGEQTTAGTTSGTYLDTHADGGGAEALREVESGGRPADRHSLLDHTWTVPVTGGTSVTLHVDAAATASGDGDAFAFSWSGDGGASWSPPVLTVPAGGSGLWSAALPPSTSGTVQVRVTDSDRTRGNRGLDTLTVDHLVVRSDSTTTSVPAAPGGLTATATSATTVDLAWADVEGESGYRLERSPDAGVTWVGVADLGAGVTTWTDSGLTAQTTYRYGVSAWNSAGASERTTVDVTTLAATEVTLTATGEKVQGSHVVHLSWTGATDVTVLRDGLPVQTVQGSTWSDHTGGKGPGSYVHEVCTTADPTACSNAVTTTFS